MPSSIEPSDLASIGKRRVDMSPLAKIPRKRVIEVAEKHVNTDDYKTFVGPYINEGLSAADLATRLNLPVQVVTDILIAAEEYIMDKHLETLPEGYSHSRKILAQYTLSSG